MAFGKKWGMIKNIEYKGYDIFYIEEREGLVGLGKEVIDGNIDVFEEFKVTKRNYVAGIIFENKKYVLKSPRNEHRIPQRKLQTIFKKGEALTTLVNLTKLKDKGFEEFVTPYMAIVKRKFGFIVESFLVMEYIEGEKIDKQEEILEIVDFGKRLHREKYYHGDFNTSNFIISDGKLKTFDTQGKKFRLGTYRKHYEVLTFSRDLLVLEYQQDGLKLFSYPKDMFYYFAIFIKGLKNTPFISAFKRYKKKLRDKGWKI